MYSNQILAPNILNQAVWENNCNYFVKLVCQSWYVGAIHSVCVCVCARACERACVRARACVREMQLGKKPI